MSYTPSESSLDNPPPKSATRFRGTGAGIGLGIVTSMTESFRSGEGGATPISIVSSVKAAENFRGGDEMPSESTSDQPICISLQEASMMESLGPSEGRFSMSPRSIPIISLVKAAANFSLDGNEITSERSSSSSSSDELICESLQEPDMKSRLSGYIEALRSQKDHFNAREEIEVKNAVLEYIDEVEETFDRELPKLLPFPAETCTLDDLIRLFACQKKKAYERYDTMGPEDNSDLILWIMHDFAYKLWGLHYSGAPHGSLKPQNVLIVEGECIFESTPHDHCESLEWWNAQTLEWKAHELIVSKTPTKASDMFTFGCLLYYCITRGSHPFGKTPEQRVSNIMAKEADISEVKDYPDAYHLISRLLNPEPELRPKVYEVVAHPFFMNARTKLYLLCQHIGYNRMYPDELKSRIPMVEDANWCQRLHEFSSTHRYSYTPPPFENFKDIFGQPGSPNFFPNIFMEIIEDARKLGFYKNCFWFGDDSKRVESDYPKMVDGHRYPKVLDLLLGPWW